MFTHVCLPLSSPSRLKFPVAPDYEEIQIAKENKHHRSEPLNNTAKMSGEAWLFLFAVLINAVNLFLQVFFTIMYSDLEWYVTTSPSPRDGRTSVSARAQQLPCH